MKNLFKNKKIGFYLIALDILLAVVLAIVFFATYKGDNGNGQLNMANKAYAALPELIGIFILAGAVVDIAALVLPEFAWIHILALICYAISFGKEIYTIPDIIVGVINDIPYEGGNFGLNLFWLGLQLAILVTGTVACFKGALDDKEVAERKAEKIADVKLIKVCSSALISVLAVAAAVSSVFVLKNMETYDPVAAKAEAERKAFVERWSPLVNPDYDFDPASVKFTEAENPYSTKKNEIQAKVGSNTTSRTGTSGETIHKVYQFEGSTAEGWQGDYSLKKAHLYLWEDGLYNGDSNGSSVYGYWFNVDTAGDETLVLVPHNNGTPLVCEKKAGSSSFYEWTVDIQASYNGGRMIKVNGFKYTPVIGIYADTRDEALEYHIGDTVNTGVWAVLQVRNNLATGSIFDAEHDVKWSNTTIAESDNGKQTLTAKWTDEGKTFETTVEVKVLSD